MGIVQEQKTNKTKENKVTKFFSQGFYPCEMLGMRAELKHLSSIEKL
jgi:hypothetical protein